MSESSPEDLSFCPDIPPDDQEIAAPIKKGEERVVAALQELVKAGKEEPPLLYLKNQAGSPLLQYDARLMRKALYIADTSDEEAIYLIGLGYDFGFCSPEETALLEAQAFAHKSDDSELLKVWEGVVERLSPESILKALFALGDENCPEEFKDYFRSDDLAKETAYFNRELAARVRQIAFPPFKNETDEELAQVGIAWHLEDPEIARWRGVEPIAPFAPVYDFDHSGDTAKAADWLLEEDFEVIEYLIQLRAEKPVAFSRLAEQFKAKAKWKKADLELLLKLKAAKEPAPEVLLEDTPRIKEEAAKIVAADQGFLYCVTSWNKSHTGDLPVGEFLFMQRGVQCVANTKGVHCHLIGPSAAGKSDAAKQYSRRTPAKYLIDATISPKLLFYKAENMPDGCTVILDDTEIVEPILGVYKKSTTNFQEGASLETVLDSPGGKGKKAFVMKMKPRIGFINTSVKNQAEDQARDRTVDLQVYSSPERIEEIKSYMADMFIDPQIAKETNEIAICKAVIDDMASHLWVVRIPFANRIILKGETRAMGVFLDLICANAAWHYTRREKSEVGAGFNGFILTATEEDFYEAKRIFEGAKGHSREKLDDNEYLVLKTLMEQGWKGTESGKHYRMLDRNELQDKTGIARQTLIELLEGRLLNGQRGDGLLTKIPQLQVYDSTKKIRLELPGGDEFRESKKKLYGLPEGFILDTLWSRYTKDLVSLKPEKPMR